MSASFTPAFQQICNFSQMLGIPNPSYSVAGTVLSCQVGHQYVLDTEDCLTWNLYRVHPLASCYLEPEGEEVLLLDTGNLQKVLREMALHYIEGKISEFFAGVKVEKSEKVKKSQKNA